jgi:hypothetical protein
MQACVAPRLRQAWLREARPVCRALALGVTSWAGWLLVPGVTNAVWQQAFARDLAEVRRRGGERGVRHGGVAWGLVIQHCCVATPLTARVVCKREVKRSVACVACR